jgi:Mrp family chromosome partitioning ATPase
MMTRALENLDKARGRALGVVLNKMSRRRGAGYYGYEYYGEYTRSTENTKSSGRNEKVSSGA